MILHFIVASHNRRELTTRSIEAAVAAAVFSGDEVNFTVFDDGSADGTAQALGPFPGMTILNGDGSAFWAKSMAQAEQQALKDAGSQDFEFIVWLNDDVILDENALICIRTTLKENSDSVVVGAVRDPETEKITYSGLGRTGLHPLRFIPITPSSTAQQIVTFNGNLVFVPVKVARALGGIDGGFSHALADIDYGLRCNRVEIPVLLAPDSYGTCPRNVVPAKRTAREDWKTFTGPKGGGNAPSLRRILKKSNPSTWPLFLGGTYSLWWLRRLTTRPSRGQKPRR